jgi:hypothetical protein
LITNEKDILLRLLLDEVDDNKFIQLHTIGKGKRYVKDTALLPLHNGCSISEISQVSYFWNILPIILQLGYEGL